MSVSPGFELFDAYRHFYVGTFHSFVSFIAFGTFVSFSVNVDDCVAFSLVVLNSANFDWFTAINN